MIKSIGLLTLALALGLTLGAVANNSSSTGHNTATDVIGCDTCGCQDGEECVCDHCCCDEDACSCESCECTADSKEACTCDNCCCGCDGVCKLEDSDSEE